MNLSKSDIIIVAVASVALWWVAYIIICGIETITECLTTHNDSSQTIESLETLTFI